MKTGRRKLSELDKAISKTQAAEERRKQDSIIEKQAIRLALMSRHNQQAAKTAVIDFLNSQKEAQ